MDASVVRVTTRLSEAAREIGEAFGNNPTGHDTLVAVVKVSGDRAVTAYFDMAGLERSKEHLPMHGGGTQREELSTSYSLTDWRPGDSVQVVVEDEDGEEVLREYVTERIAASFDESESEFTHKNGSVEERLDDLHERVSALEE